MESGLEDRNNRGVAPPPPGRTPVSMESGLEDRNNSARIQAVRARILGVSMESGLEDRNNGRLVPRCVDLVAASQWSPA